MCNRAIKLGKLLDFAIKLGCEKLATGHYVRIENGLLKVALDESKDQSYFLANVKKDALKNMIFPLGNSYKKDIKACIANFPELIEIAGQKESSEICFVENSYIDILNKHFNTNTPGVIKNSNGEIVGKHDGYMHYTIGKRRGFSVFGAHEPHYVTKIDAKNNEIIVGLKNELLENEFETINLNEFLNLNDEFRANIKIRYRSSKIKGTIKKLENGGTKVILDEKISGIASGQLAVFYDDLDRVLASGFIK